MAPTSSEKKQNKSHNAAHQIIHRMISVKCFSATITFTKIPQADMEQVWLAQDNGQHHFLT